MKNVKYEQFAEIDVRVGTVISAKVLKQAIKPAYKMVIDFGEEIGELNSSAQITEQYSVQDLLGKQILAVVNFPEKQIANFISQCLVLGVYHQSGVVLLRPDKQCVNGEKVG